MNSVVRLSVRMRRLTKEPNIVEKWKSIEEALTRKLKQGSDIGRSQTVKNQQIL